MGTRKCDFDKQLTLFSLAFLNSMSNGFGGGTKSVNRASSVVVSYFRKRVGVGVVSSNERRQAAEKSRAKPDFVVTQSSL